MTNRPKKLIKNTLQRPCYRYDDAETGQRVPDIHQDLATPRWRVTTPAGTSEPVAGIAAAARLANSILRQQGYQEIHTPAP